MRCSIDSLLIAVRQAVAAAGCAAFVITGNATSAEPEAGAVTARGLERTADDAIAKANAVADGVRRGQWR